MKEYLENRIKSLSERSAKLWDEYEKTTGATETAIIYIDCLLLDERLAELNDVLTHLNAQLQQLGVMRGGQLITKIEEDICDELSYLPNAGVTPNGVSLVAFDSVVEIVRKAFKAACASGAAGTVAERGVEQCTCPDQFCLLGDHPTCRWAEYARKSSEGQP